MEVYGQLEVTQTRDAGEWSNLYPWYLLQKWLGGLLELARMQRPRNLSLTLPRAGNRSPAHSLITTPTELQGLQKLSTTVLKKICGL
jgi:hypothetical protein